MRLLRGAMLSPIAVAMIAQFAVAGSGLQFSNETATRLVAEPAVGINDIQQKAFAWGDVDQDGDPDLACVRKEPWMSLGKRRNVLFMNEGGVLVDRTTKYAIEADDGGMGFLDLTNDTDVIFADVNGDGWRDMVTAVTLSDGSPKSISHPRIYINKGMQDGAWQGFRYEQARIPQLHPTAALHFQAVAAGDVTGDSLPDLYFVDSDPPPETFDFNNRLLINNGMGFFTDESAIRMTPQMLQSGWGTAAAVRDMNGDGALDVVKASAVSSVNLVAISYNDQGNLGTFAAYDVVFNEEAKFVAAADLNLDGRLDLVIPKHYEDVYLLNLGNGADGLADFSTETLPQETFLNGGDTVIADLDDDGWDDIIITDVDHEYPGCVQESDLLINLANAPDVSFEAESDALPAGPMSGVHDAAILDLDGDGRLDVVLGRCTGIQIWMNRLACQGDLKADGLVNPIDLAVLLGAWGPNPGHAADLNDDEAVDAADLAILLGEWGPCP